MSIINGEQFFCREIEEKDDSAVAALIRDNLKKHSLDIPGTVYYDEGLDHLSDFYAGPKRSYYVLLDAKERIVGGIGFAGFEPMEDTAELQKLYLDDSVKGAGLGYELIALIEKTIEKTSTHVVLFRFYRYNIIAFQSFLVHIP